MNNKKIKRTSAVSSTGKVYNGKLSSLGSPNSMKSMKINRLGINLSKNGNLKIQPHMENEQLSLDILNSIGCSQVTDSAINSANYSLLTKQTDAEIIMNPNKIDTSIFDNIGKGKVSFNKVIADENNNFYRLDQEIPKNYTREQNSIKQTTQHVYQVNNVVSKLYDINFLNPSAHTLRSLTRQQ